MIDERGDLNALRRSQGQVDLPLHGTVAEQHALALGDQIAGPSAAADAQGSGDRAQAGLANPLVSRRVERISFSLPT